MLEIQQFGARKDIPDLSGLVERGGHKAATIGRKRGTINGSAKARENVQLRTRTRVPYPCSLVLRRRYNLGTIRTEAALRTQFL